MKCRTPQRFQPWLEVLEERCTPSAGTSRPIADLLAAHKSTSVFPAAATKPATNGGQGNPGVLPVNAKFHGLTYGEWGAKWWQAAFATPIVNGDHPLFSGGAFGDEKGILFLSGVGGAPTIDITIPSGTALFFPIANSSCSVYEPDPYHGDNEAELREYANGHIDNTSARFATIDGVAVKNLDSYRVESPLFEWGPVPADNIVGAPAGTTSPSVDAGYYLLLAPLRVGQHVIHFGGTFDELEQTFSATYNITVAPGKSQAASGKQGPLIVSQTGVDTQTNSGTLQTSIAPAKANSVTAPGAPAATKTTASTGPTTSSKGNTSKNAKGGGIVTSLDDPLHGSL